MNKDTVKYTAFSAFLIVFVLSFILFLYTVPATKKSYHMNLEESTQSALVTAVPQLEKALKKGDDIALYIQIENLAKSKDISKAYILHKSGKVLMHTDTKEWGKNYDSQEHLKHTNYKSAFFKKSGRDYLYSVAVDKDKFLFLIISSDRLNSYLIAEYKKMFYISIICLFTGIVISFIFFRSFLLNPICKLRKYLHSSSMDDKLVFDEKYEFMGILKIVCDYFKRK